MTHIDNREIHSEKELKSWVFMDFPHIRTMELPDLEQVSELARQLGYPNQVNEVKARFHELTGRSDHSLVVFAKEEEILGYIHLEKIYGLLSDPRVEIKALVVEEKSRNIGIGKSLVDFGKHWAKTNGMHTITVRTNIIREKAQRFYQREGFELKKTSNYFAAKI